MEEVISFLREHIEIISVLAILVVVLILLLHRARKDKEEGLKRYTPVAESMAALILFCTLFMVYIQIGHLQGQNKGLQEQNELQRAVVSKSAIQDLNEVILKEENKDFLFFLFPHLRDNSKLHDKETKKEQEAREARETMMAFSLMNSLEMLYLTQDDKRRKDAESRDKFKCLLRDFTVSVHPYWKNNFPTVYHPDFRQIVNEIFDNPPECPKPNEEEK